MSVDGAFSGQPCQDMNMVICEHLFRQGKMEVGEALVKVCVSVCVCVCVCVCFSRLYTPHRRRS